MTITKERLLKIQHWRETYGADSNVMLPAEEAEELARIALASLDAEPVGEVSEKRHGLVMDGTVDLGGKSTYRIIKGEKAMKRLPLGTKFYIVPPVPVDNEFIPKNLDRALGVVGVALPESKEEFNFQIERWIQRLIDRVIRYADEFKEQPAPVVPEECPAELPYAQVKAAADLYALCWQSGEVVTYTPDPEKATIWLNNYSGTCVQEYVKLERFQGVASDNSPVIPDDWISCSERMPAQDDWVLIYSKHGEYLAGQVQGEYVELNDGTLSWLGSALHWMLLPEPPQEVK
ncbi:DUF551 domain-containing protein [Salmonella enterica]|nr:DUF551 domain-containing protein [Salmonella enterica subsp. enterica serovar Oranienburg]EAX0788010.1 DUF551 domain-containing protein [Salmonella enterica]OIV03868.1 hypothetical protein APP86_04695 [Salmonella enterica subsp. houtenae]EAX0791815.1 DUF551 domain-containing protein [Salmonella enterica]EBI8447271.1 DUF551 domain-containing protein [Salmonella enterica]